MSKFKSQKGFTLAELLVVVAIIAVLVAVAIPVFSASQKKAKLAADHAAIRDAYALVQIANNLEQVEVQLNSGEMRTFAFSELMTGSSIPGEPDERVLSYVLSKDCSHLVDAFSLDPSKVYTYQASGTDGETTCPDCSKWDNSAAAFSLSQLHSEGWPIYAFFDITQRQIVLGLPN